MASVLKIGLLLITGACYVTAFAIRGVLSDVDPVSGLRPFRRNILDLSKEGPQWDLYIQALHNYSQTKSTDQFSNFQISGMVIFERRVAEGLTYPRHSRLSKDPMGWCE